MKNVESTQVLKILQNSLKRNINIDYKLVPTTTYKLRDIIAFDPPNNLFYIMVNLDRDTNYHYFICIKNNKPTGESYQTDQMVPVEGDSNSFRFSTSLIRQRPHKVMGKIVIESI